MRIIGGKERGRTIEAPAGRHTRPTLDRVRENMFNVLQADVPDSRVLDLFAGSGALSLEAVSRGAESAVLVDNDRNASETEKSNIARLHYENRTRAFHCDWKKAVETLRGENALFDLVFLDPPYAMLDLREVFNALVPVIHEDTLIVLEHEAGKQYTAADGFETVKDRSWGFCAMTVFKYMKPGE